MKMLKICYNMFTLILKGGCAMRKKIIALGIASTLAVTSIASGNTLSFKNIKAAEKEVHLI